MIKKLLPALIFLFTIFFFFSNTAYSSTNFKSDYKVIYTVNDAGTTHADINITLTNTTAEYFASSYQIELGFEEITNIKASAPSGPLNATIDKNEKGYSILLEFDKKSVGLGAKLPLKLSFDTENVTQKVGNVWEINIPGLANPEEFNSFSVEVKHPESFGKPAYIKPKKTDNNLVFDKSDLGKSGVSIAYGTKKIYNFDLTYHIKNNNLFPMKSEIALPPDTNYQTVIIQDIDPMPESVTIDTDGNWIAKYNLAPAEGKDIKVTGMAEVKSTPDESRLTPEEKKTYTQETKNWQANDPQIKKISSELKTPKAIYEFVVKTLKYDPSRVTQGMERIGGINALKNPNSAVCREFADLFITLARSAGIPAREVDGYAHTNDNTNRPLSLIGDILHSWPEYYDFEKKTWVMVDPTWGSTTGGTDYFEILDFNHLTFVIKGQNDDSPIPAGGYKQDKDSTKKDVEISFSDEFPGTKQLIELTTQQTDDSIAGLLPTTRVKITNNGQGATPVQLMNIQSRELSPKEQLIEIPSIPPYGSIVVDVKFDRTGLLTNKHASSTIRFGDKTLNQQVKISPFYFTTLGKVGAAFGIFTIIILIIAGKSRRLRILR